MGHGGLIHGAYGAGLLVAEVWLNLGDDLGQDDYARIRVSGTGEGERGVDRGLVVS